MKKIINRILSSLLVAVMILTAAPLNGFVGLKLNLDWLKFDWIDFSTKSVALESSGSCGTNVTYTFNESTGLLTISGSGRMYGYSYSSSPFYNNGSIRTVIIENGVTSIGSYAFSNCTGLTSITIPDSVTNIGDSAFSGCTSLTSIEIPGSITSIGSYAFYGCTSLTSITIPDSVTSIGYYAFYGCTGLTSITIPDSITSIGGYVFSGCTCLTSIVVDENNTVYDSRDNCNAIINTAKNELVTGCKNTVIPDSVTSIGYGAFSNCTGLTSITIPDSVTNIGDSAFSGCTSLTSIEIPGSITSIGSYAFYGCTSLTSITIPDSVTSIGSDAFYGCRGLTSVNINSIEAWCKISFDGDNSNPLCYAHNLYVNGELVTELTIPDSVTSIGYYAFYGCTGLTNITIPDSVTSIDSYAFTGCTGLTSVTIGNSVTSIGGSAFSCCTGLTSITIPDSVTSIGEYTFYGCTNLASVTIGNSVTNIGYDAFSNCTGLTSVTIGNSVTSIGNKAFYGCTGLKKVNINSIEAWCKISFNLYDSNPLCYAHNLYVNGELVTELTIPDSVISIGNYAFYNCTGLTSVTIPDSVTSIGYSAFDGCTGLKELTMPCSAKIYNSQYTFYDCKNIEKVTLTKGTGTMQNYGTSTSSSATNTCYTPWYISRNSIKEIIIEDGVTRIGDYAFYGCTGLTSVTIGNSVTSIGNYTFYGCTGLKELTMPCSAKIYNSQYTFYDCKNIEKVTLTKGTGTMQNYDTSTSSSATNTFYKYTPWYISRNSIKEIIIEDGVTRIGDYAFYGCTGLTSITIGNGVTIIGHYAFSDCTGLTSVNINSIEAWCKINFYTASSNPLYYAHNLYLNGELVTELTIPNSVTSIGFYAFYYCTGLASITIPDSVTSIGDGAFYGCRGLTSITIPDSVTSIGGSAFYGCTGLTSITIPDSVTSIGGYAFYGCTGLTSIIIPDSVTSIGRSAFSHCSNIKSVEIPDNVNLVDACAFFECTSLESVSIGKNLTTLGDDVFNGCVNLKTLNYNAKNCEFKGGYADEYKDYCYYPFEGLVSLTNVNIGEDVEVIPNCFIRGCRGVTAIVIPEGVNRISKSAFYNCSNIKSVTIPQSMLYIEDFAFYKCTGLTNVIFTDGVTTVGSEIFNGCLNLNSVTIPDTVKNINENAFYNCPNIKDVYYSGTEEEWKNIVWENGNTDLRIADIHFNCEAVQSSGIVSVSFDDTSVAKKLYKVEVKGNPGQLRVSYPDGGTSSYLRDNKKVSIEKTDGGEIWTIEMTLPAGSYNIKAKYGERWSKTAQFEVSLIGKIISVDYNNSADAKKVFNFSVSGNPYQLRLIYPDGGTSSYTKDNKAVKSVKKTADGEIWSIEISLPAGTYEVKAQYGSKWSESESFLVEMIGKVSEVTYDAAADGRKTVKFRVTGSPEQIKVTYPDGGTSTYYKDDSDVNHKTVSDGELWTIVMNLPAGKYNVKAKYNTKWSENTEFTVAETSHTHSYTAAVTKPTCTKQGYTTYTCSCGDSYKDNYISATGHKEGEWKVTKPATTTETGIKTLYCSICGEAIRTEIIPKLESSAAKVNGVSLGDVAIDYKASTRLNPRIDADSDAKYNIEYKSSDTSVVTVDNNGNVYGAKTGSAIITCTVTDTCGNVVSDTCKVTVSYSIWQWIVKIVLFGWIWY